MQAVTDSAPSFFDRLPEVLTRTLREGLLWVLGAVALLLVLSLLTFDPADPGFAYTGEPGQVTNLIGPLGAWVADVLLLLFGGPAYLWPVVVFGLGWWLFRGQPEVDGGGRASLLLRSAGFIATLVSSCALATMHFPQGMLRNTAGGILGSVVGTAIENAMGNAAEAHGKATKSLEESGGGEDTEHMPELPPSVPGDVKQKLEDAFSNKSD